MAAGYSFDYDLTPNMMVDAVDAFLESMKAGPPDRNVRKGALGFGVLFVQVLVLLIVTIVAEMDLWLIVATAAMTAIFGACTGLYALVAFGHPVSRGRIERAIGKAFQELESQRIRWTLSEDRFHVEPSQRDHLWADVHEAYVGRNYWILHLESQLRLLLPVSALPAGAERYMLDRLTNAGVELRIEKPVEHE